MSRLAEILDNLIELLCNTVHKISRRAEKRVAGEWLRKLRLASQQDKDKILYQVAEVAVEQPNGVISQVLYPLVGEQTLKQLAEEAKAQRPKGGYRDQVHQSMRESYRHHYRRMLPPLLKGVTFHSEQAHQRPLLEALEWLKTKLEVVEEKTYFGPEQLVPLEWLNKKGERGRVEQSEAEGQVVIDRLGYEMLLLEHLREGLRHREIWVEGAWRYRNPAQDLPDQQQWEAQRPEYFKALNLPLGAGEFIQSLKTELQTALANFNRTLPANPKVKLRSEGQGRISLSPLEALPEPPTLAKLKAEISRRWPMTPLLEVLKETALRTGFLEIFRTATVREQLDEATLHKRLLLCLFALGTNSGLKRVSAGDHGQSYRDLLYVRHRYILKDYLRSAVRQVANAIFEIRPRSIWGEASTACASDSTKFAAVDQIFAWVIKLILPAEYG